MFGVYKYPEKPVMINENPRHLCRQRYICPGVPNATYKSQRLWYLKDKYGRKDAIQEKAVKEELKQVLLIKNQKHCERNILQRIIRERVDTKMKEYEVEIDKRREKLNDILAKEENDYITEVIKQVQTFTDLQFEENKQKAIDIKKKAEENRVEYCREMRFRQCIEKCDKLRTMLSHQQRLDAVASQKLQKEEVKLRKAVDKELEEFWIGLQNKQAEAIKEAEKQKELKQIMRQKETHVILQHQLEEHKALELKRKEEQQRDAEELERIKEKIKQEDQAERDRKRKQTEEYIKKLDAHIKLRQENKRNQKEEEIKISSVFDKMVEDELRREEERKQRNPEIAKKLLLFSQYKKEIEIQRLEAEKEIERVQQALGNEITRKNEEKACKEIQARNDLLQSCISTNEIMIEEKRKERARLKKMEDEENKFYEHTRDISNKLNAEAARQKKLAIAKYRSDLDGQVRYAESIKQRQREEEKRFEKVATEEEEEYHKIVHEVVRDFEKHSKIQPFRKVIIEEKCLCAKPIY